MAAPVLIEASLCGWLASFDGRTLELFSPYCEGSVRHHLRLIAGFAIEDDALILRLSHFEECVWPFEASERDQVARLVSALAAAAANA